MTQFVERLHYDTSITAESFFPDWIITDMLRFERLTEQNLPPSKLRELRQNNPDFDAYFPRSEHLDGTYQSVLEWYELADEYWTNRTHAFYPMFLRETGEFIGMTFLEDVELQLNSGKLGIWIDEAHRGKSLGLHFAEAFTVVAFRHLQLDIVRIDVVQGNQPSVKFVEKYMSAVGGQYEGKTRNATKTPSNGIKDLHQWSLSQTEFASDEAQYQRDINPDL